MDDSRKWLRDGNYTVTIGLVAVCQQIDSGEEGGHDSVGGPVTIFQMPQEMTARCALFWTYCNRSPLARTRMPLFLLDSPS